MNCVSIANLEFSYHKAPKTPLLSIESFELKAGDHLFLYGESGSGKSTLLNLLCGILTPTKGDLSVCGMDMTRSSARARDQLRGEKLGVIFQQFNLVNYLSALENITLPASFHKLDNCGERAISLAKKLGLEKIIHQKANTLSLGEQQRVAAARALLGKPQLIIADEPTSSLDNKNTDRFLEGLFEAAHEQNTAILFVSHDQHLKSHFKNSVSLSEISKGVKQ